VPFIHGRATTVLFNSTNLSGYLNASDFAHTSDMAETTVYGLGYKTYLQGQSDATASFTGLYDPGLPQLNTALGVDSGVLTYSAGAGATIGDLADLMLVSGTSLTKSAPVGDVVAIGWNVQSEATVAIGYILHPLGADTNTTTGAEKDDTAATTSGWTAHLHVTAVSGGSWVVKLQDAAVSNTYSDVTSGSFTAATGATQQRLSSASGATLRRYVRYTATRTGGTAGDTITFLLALARNV